MYTQHKTFLELCSLVYKIFYNRINFVSMYISTYSYYIQYNIHFKQTYYYDYYYMDGQRGNNNNNHNIKKRGCGKRDI